jgi:hypothetical protein
MFFVFGAIKAKRVPKSKNGDFFAESPIFNLLQKFGVFQKLKNSL